MGLSRSLRRTANKALAPFSLELRRWSNEICVPHTRTVRPPAPYTGSSLFDDPRRRPC